MSESEFMDVPIAVIETMLKKQRLEDAEKALLIKVVNARHLAAFGPEGKAKTLALKLKDLQTQEVIDKIAASDAELHEAFAFNRHINEYFYGALYLLSNEFGQGWSKEKYLAYFDNNLKPAIMSRWRELYGSKEIAIEQLAHQRNVIATIDSSNDEFLSNLNMNRMYVSLPTGGRTECYRHFPAYVKFLINSESDDYYIDENDVTQRMLMHHIINKDEAALIRSLLSYVHYNRRGKKLLDDLATEHEHITTGECSFYGHEIDLSVSHKGLKNLLHKMEQKCASLGKTTESTGLQSFRVAGNYTPDVRIKTLPDVLTDRTFIDIMREIQDEFQYAINEKTVPTSFRFHIADQRGYDLGGVTRMVIYKIAEYLSLKLKKEHGRFYMCNTDGTPLNDKFLKYVTYFFILVLVTGTKVDLPLSNGLLYLFANGNYKNEIGITGKVPLETLMALYRTEDPEELNMILNMVTMSDDEIAEYLPQYPQSSQIPQGAEYNSNTKLAWLTNILHKKVFYPFSKDASDLVKMAALLPSRVWYGGEYHYLPRFDPLYSISMVASHFKIPMSAEIMKAIPIVAGEGSRGAVVKRNIAHLKRFINEHPERWEALLVYIHGSLRTDKEITINNVAGGLPVAHTCFGSMDIKPYETYELFEKDFIFAIENTSGLHLA